MKIAGTILLVSVSMLLLVAANAIPGCIPLMTGDTSATVQLFALIGVTAGAVGVVVALIAAYRRRLNPMMWSYGSEPRSPESADQEGCMERFLAWVEFLIYLVLIVIGIVCACCSKA